MSTAIAEQPKREMTIRDRLRDPNMIAEMGKAMPKHCSPDRMARVAMTAMTRTPKLAECSQASFFKCLLELSQWGLEPDGRRAHLIPFENRKLGIVECQLIIDWKGLAELVYRSGIVTKLHADVVHEGDDFEYSMGEVVRHVPWFIRRDANKPEKQGDVFAAYAQASLVGGMAKAEVLSKEEVESVRKRSRAGSSGPWMTDWCEMAKKTAFRRLSKWLPLSADIRDAMDRDDDRFEPIAIVKTQRQEISDITAGLIAEGERYLRTEDESQADYPNEITYDQEKRGGGDAVNVPQTQDERTSETATAFIPTDDTWSEIEFALHEAKTLADVKAVGNKWAGVLTREGDLALLDKSVEQANERIRSKRGK